MRRAVIFDYSSIFARDIPRAIQAYNSLCPGETVSVDIFRAEKYRCESLVGRADTIIHSGGDGVPVSENVANTPKLYISHPRQWQAQIEGGEIIQLKEKIEGIWSIDILEDDDILGRKGRIPILKYHELAVISPPMYAKVIATSKAHDLNGKKIEIIEALRYPDGSISIQGHPEEGTAFHIFYNFLEKLGC